MKKKRENSDRPLEETKNIEPPESFLAIVPASPAVNEIQPAKPTTEENSLSARRGLLTRTGTNTGSGGIPWKFYWDLNRFLGSLPANDASLMEESGCRAILLFNGMVHGGVGELQELRTDSVLLEASLESCEAQASLLESAAEIVPAAPTTTAAEKKRLAAPAKRLAQLLNEQRQLRYSMERHKSEPLAMQRKRLEIIKRSETRDDKLLDILQKMYKDK
ncbi:hypothetical protein HPB49_007253 [Dermacentor silvarum]|uniref:Uncharacterized protein n=1 Tax=Dermacentor silvarum TaxID=543639 RepID=A0ACB8DX15_DERSI|nr:hypothetical protein HPB49_007253 [Dermacentor silvarum]